MSNYSYLNDYPHESLPEPLRKALAALELEFDVDLHAVTKQMLWEFDEGLNRKPGDQDLDEHLPMMCARREARAELAARPTFTLCRTGQRRAPSSLSISAVPMYVESRSI